VGVWEDGLRSEGHSEASGKALAEVGRRRVVDPRRRLKKQRIKRERVRLGEQYDITALPPSLLNSNETVKVTIELPAGMVAAAGSRLNEYCYEGVRSRVSDWWGPRFLIRVMAKGKFTL
jgi:hypothetical protein